MIDIDNDGYIVNPFQQFIASSRYARWDEAKGRRETWEETVDRYMIFMKEHIKTNNNYNLTNEEYDELRSSILKMDILPSMRALMTAGPALKKNHIAAYNCSYIPVDSPRSFDEILYILMHGTGVGFSIESRYVDKMPIIADEFEETSTVIVVEDSKEGWQKSFKELIAMLYAGNLPQWDTSRVRPKGARLKTFGGRSSGPEPLENLFEFTVNLFKNSSGQKLTSLQCHDLVCKIAEIVVVGGVRRSALISLSDLNDKEISKSKTGEWWTNNSQRSLANNSAVYNSRPSIETFFEEWLNLIESKSGERGIFNRKAAAKAAGRSGRRQIEGIEFGTNPCSEINLRPYQFCNLSTVPIQGEDSIEDIKKKVRLATILGTFQATLTNFKGLRSIWKKNTEEERLLGVSMTGIFGNINLNGKGDQIELENNLQLLKQIAIDTNKIWSEKLGIAQSTAVTCIKPEGTTSSLTMTSSGIHPWHNDYYIRTVRGDRKDPLTQFLIDSGISYEEDVMNSENVVFSFPMKAPDYAITRKDISAVEHLNLWLTYQRYWCEHKPSVTINVKDDEWADVAAWVWKHFDEVTGVSFLPYSDHTYKQAPYQDINSDIYNKLVEGQPLQLIWSLLAHYEETDEAVIGGRELACSAAGGCEVLDLTNTSTN